MLAAGLGAAAATGVVAGGRRLQALHRRTRRSSAAHSSWGASRLSHCSTRPPNKLLLKASFEHPAGESFGVGAVQGSSHLKPVSSQPPSNAGGATAKVAAFTGAYITAFGAAVLVFPKQLFSLLFPAR